MAKKKKLTLEALRVQSFATTLKPSEQAPVQGGDLPRSFIVEACVYTHLTTCPGCKG